MSRKERRKLLVLPREFNKIVKATERKKKELPEDRGRITEIYGSLETRERGTDKHLVGKT